MSAEVKCETEIVAPNGEVKVMAADPSLGM